MAISLQIFWQTLLNFKAQERLIKATSSFEILFKEVNYLFYATQGLIKLGLEHKFEK
jgi:hypothetical protein